MYKMMAIEEEHVYRATRLPNAIVERHLSRLSPSFSPAIRCAPRRGSRFRAPLVARKIPLVRGQGGRGRLRSGRSRSSPGPAAALGALGCSENIETRAPGRSSAPRLPRREPRRPCKTGRAGRGSPVRRTIRPCTAERGPWAGRADGYVAGRERSQGKLGRHLLAEGPRSAAWQPIGAIKISPATFDGKPRRCGTSVGGY